MLNRDAEYLGKLRDYYAEHRVLPSYSAVAALLGLRSTSAVAALVKRGREAGFLARAPDGRLQPGPRFFERTILPSPGASGPAPGADAPAPGLQIDAYLIDQPSRTVLLTVEDDSMSAAGLLPGDTLVVKRQAPAQPGDVVVAVVDRKFTVRYLAHDRNGFFLKAGNSAYAPSLSSEELEIYGRVVASFRKYPNASRS